MLIVSRKENQTVVFPSLGISVEIIKVAGQTVRVGIDAPNEIRILRGELVKDSDQRSLSESRSHKLLADEAKNGSLVGQVDCNSNEVECAVQENGVKFGVAEKSADGSLNHELRNRLNRANLALSLVQKQLSLGQVAAAEKSLALALETFAELEKNPAADVFRNQLPHSQAVNSQAASLAQAVSSTPAPTKANKPKRALLVEDNPNERELLASYLRASGYIVDTAEDGQAALEYLSQHKPDAVVMDMEMPRLSGGETVAEIRHDDHFNDVKLFIVSGLSQEKTKIPTGDRGVQRWFQKPLRPEDLVNELSASLN